MQTITVIITDAAPRLEFTIHAGEHTVQRFSNYEQKRPFKTLEYLVRDILFGNCVDARRLESLGKKLFARSVGVKPAQLRQNKYRLKKKKRKALERKGEVETESRVAHPGMVIIDEATGLTLEQLDAVFALSGWARGDLRAHPNTMSPEEIKEYAKQERIRNAKTNTTNR